MMRFRNKGNSIVLLAGVAAGAALMALAVTIVFGLKTGIAGAVLVILVIAVSALSWWFAGMQQQLRESSHAAYMKGYHEGLEKKTLVIRQPGRSVSIRMRDKTEATGCRERSQ